MTAAVSCAKPLPTIWEIPDELWARIEPILAAHYPPARTGRPHADLRRVLNGIIYRMRSGVRWNQLPPEFGDDSTVHRWFQAFVGDGVLEEVWATLLVECEALGDLDWTWQAVDGMMGKARLGGEKRGEIPLTAGNRAPRRVSTLRRPAARSGSRSMAPMCTTPNCWPRR